jgi:hypothetical protein
MFRPTTFKVPQVPPPDILTINNFKGINVLGADSEIDIAESPDMKNVVLDQFGRLDERFGYKHIQAVTLGATAINGIFNINGKVLISQGGFLYEFTLAEIEGG